MYWIALGALVAGCLSTPGPATSDAGGDDDDGGGDGGGGDGPGGDGAPPSCRSAALPAGQDWPPAGIEMRHAQIADVDRDGHDDLVVSVAPTAAQAAGPSRVYILYGPVDRADPKYHAALDVGVEASFMPWATTVEDVDGDGCAELTAAGPPVMGSSRSFVAVWHHDGSAQPWNGPPQRTDLTREPPQGPLLALWADLTTDSDRDLIVADLNAVGLYVGATPSALPGVLTVPGPDLCGWGNINALVAQPAANGRERVIAFGHYRWNTISVETGGTMTVSANCTDNQNATITRGAAYLDLDGAAPFDVFSGGGGWIGAHLVSGSADPVTPATSAAGCPATPRGSDDYIEGFAAGDLGGFATPEVVIIDHDDQTSMSYACLLDAIDVSPTQVIRTAANELALGAGVARNVVVGDLDGVTRAWIFMRDGELTCLQRGAAANLEVCQ
jgi:hypothetical protein